VPSTLSPNYKKQFALTLPIKLSATLSVFGFIPWETLLSLDIKIELVQTMMSGTLGLSSLLLCLTCSMIYLLRLNNWFSGIVILFFPPLLCITSFIWLISLFGPARWLDVNVYKNGDRYLVLQSIVYGPDGVETHYRLVETKSINQVIRHITIVKQADFEVDIFESKQVSALGTIWQKQL
jgi:hypothetical protein